MSNESRRSTPAFAGGAGAKALPVAVAADTTRQALAVLLVEARRANSAAMREFGRGLIDVNVIDVADAALSAPTERIVPEGSGWMTHPSRMAVLYAGVTRGNIDALWQAYRGAVLAAAPSPSEPAQDPAHVWMTRELALIDERDKLRTALEVIAIGECADPVFAARQLLVETGHWLADGVAHMNAQEPAGVDALLLASYAQACMRQDSAGMREGYIKLRDAFAAPSPAEPAQTDAAIAEAFGALAAQQQPLAADIAKIVGDNLQDLYASNTPATPAQEPAGVAAESLLQMVLDDLDVCIAERGTAYEFTELSEETVDALKALKAPARATPAAPVAPIEAWNPPESAPKDGSLIRLLVEFTEHSLDDSTEPQATIGMNNLANTEADEWQFAGWCWTHDRFTQGEGRVVGWLPLVSAPPPAEAREQLSDAEVIAARDATWEKPPGAPHRYYGESLRFAEEVQQRCAAKWGIPLVGNTEGQG